MEDMRQAVIDYYQRIERLGLVEGSQLFAESLEVEINPFDPKRVDVVVKPMFVQQLRIVADLVGKHPELEEPYDRGQKVRVSRILG
jgi:phage tail sheath gpL-like